MNTFRYEPLDLFNRLNEQLNRGWSRQLPSFLGDEESNVVTSSWIPAVDVLETDDQFIIEADVPGVKPKDIEVTMENGVLSIKGERAAEPEAERRSYRRMERSRGNFYRRFTMPETADSEHVSAATVNGVLKINIPKRAAVTARRIKVTD